MFFGIVSRCMQTYLKYTITIYHIYVHWFVYIYICTYICIYLNHNMLVLSHVISIVGLPGARCDQQTFWGLLWADLCNKFWVQARLLREKTGKLSAQTVPLPVGFFKGICDCKAPHSKVSIPFWNLLPGFLMSETRKTFKDEGALLVHMDTFFGFSSCRRTF